MAKDKGRVGKKEGGVDWLIRKFVAVFATIMVVVGVAAVGYLAGDTMEELKEEVSQATSTVIYAPGIVVLNSEGARLFGVDGRCVRDLSWPSDTAIFDKPLSQINGVDAVTGKEAWFGNGFFAASGTRHRSPDGRREVYLKDERADGSRPLIVTYGNDEDMSILRYGGEIIKNAEIIGWQDDKTILFTGSASSSKLAYAWDLGLGARPIGRVQANAYDYKIRDGAIYYLTSKIQSDNGTEHKVSPGILFSLNFEGEEKEIAKQNDSVITKYALGEGVIAYETADTSLFLKTATSDRKIGQGMPLFFIDDDDLVYTSRDKIKIMDISGDGDERELAEAEKTAIFYLEKVRMDESPRN